MAQPTPYTRQTDFSTDEAGLVAGRSTVRTARVDAELDALGLTANETRVNLGIIQRDDTKLRDGAVELHTLAADVRALLSTNSANPRGAWLTATVYAVGDLVTQSPDTYICAVAHTSGVFATDLAAVRWMLVAAGDARAASVDSQTATASQTLFPLSRAITQGLASSVVVTVDGLQLEYGVDFTHASATSILFAVPFVGGERVTFFMLPALSGGFDATQVSTTASGAGAVARSQQSKNAEIVSVGDFGAVGDGVTDDTAALQSAINYASNNGAPEVFIPAGIWKYSRLYNYYDASLNPGFNATKMGRVRIVGAGKLDAREANLWPAQGFAGTVLLSTVTTGNCFNLSPSSADGGAYPARENALENISLVGNTTGFVISHWCAIESKMRNVTVLQLNAAGSGIFWKNAWFTHWDTVYVTNRNTTGQTGVGVDFGASLFAGSFRFSNCYFERFQDGFVVNESQQSVALLFDGVCTFQGNNRDGLAINAAIRSLVIDTPYFEFNGRSHFRCTLAVGGIHSLAIRGGFALGGSNTATSMTGPMFYIRNTVNWSIDGLAVFRPWTDIVDIGYFSVNGTVGAIKNTCVDASDNNPTSDIYLARVDDQRAMPVFEGNALLGDVNVKEFNSAAYMVNSKHGALGLEAFAFSGTIQRRNVALNETVYLQAATTGYMQVLNVMAAGSIIAMPGVPNDGRQIVIANQTASASSTSVRQSNATTVISALTPGQALICYYDTTATKWVAIGPLVFSGL